MLRKRPGAGILKQYLGARRTELEKGCRTVPARQVTQPGGIGSLESIFGLIKSLTIRAQVYRYREHYIFMNTVTYFTLIYLKIGTVLISELTNACGVFKKDKLISVP